MKIELADVKEAFEQHKKYSEKMISAVGSNTDNESISKQWEIWRQIYMRDLIDTKQSSVAQINKLELTIENLKQENAKLVQANDLLSKQIREKDTKVFELKQEHTQITKQLELKLEMATYELEVTKTNESHSPAIEKLK